MGERPPEGLLAESRLLDGVGEQAWLHMDGGHLRLPEDREGLRVGPAVGSAGVVGELLLEDVDRKVLDDPEGAILRPGGCILMAEDGDRIVGCCALIRIAPHAFELAKMAVTPAARGKGIGMLLGRAAVERALKLGARRVELLSNTLLQPALGLYRKLGFVEVPLGPTEYRRANIKMVLQLEAGLKGM